MYATASGYQHFTRKQAETWLGEGGTVRVYPDDNLITPRAASISNYFPHPDCTLRLTHYNGYCEVETLLQGLSFDVAWRMAREWCK